MYHQWTRLMIEKFRHTYCFVFGNYMVLYNDNGTWRVSYKDGDKRQFLKSEKPLTDIRDAFDIAALHRQGKLS